MHALYLFERCIMTRVRWRARDYLQQHLTHVTSTGATDINSDYPTPLELQVTVDTLNPVGKLGKTLNMDIGGPFDSLRIRKSYSGDCGVYTLWKGTSLQRLTAFWTPQSSLLHTDPVREAQVQADAIINRAVTVWGPSNSSTAAVVSDYQGAYSPPGRLTTSTNGQMDVLGTTFIDLCKPTTPAFDLATTVAEFLADRSFFSIPGTADNLAGEYLNYSLAISPTINDLKTLRFAMEHQDEIIAQYERDAGKPIHRSMAFAPSVITQRHVWLPVSNKFPSTDGVTTPSVTNYALAGTDTMTVTTTTKSWFSGTFTYSVPQEGWRRTLSELDRVYGIKPGFDTVWNAIPFSFVADYFADTGRVLRNLSTFMTDGLVMPYGYVMHSTTHEVEHVWEGLINTTRSVAPTTPVRLVAKYLVEIKQRQRATPFGFGFNMGSLTTRQKSILAALGIVRVL
jgi:hypothetical protein